MTTQRATILRGTENGPGLLTANGSQKLFELMGDWKSDVAPRAGMTVDVTFDDSGRLIAVHAVPEAQLLREQIGKGISSGLKHTGSLRTGYLARLGTGPLIGVAVLLLSFFVLPALTVGALGFGRSFTGWDALAFDARMMGAGSHGILSLLALIALPLPLATPMVGGGWRRRFFLAPLAFLLLEVGSLLNELRTITAGIREWGGGDMVQATGGMLQPAFGVLLLLVAAIYLATFTLRRRQDAQQEA